MIRAERAGMAEPSRPTFPVRPYRYRGQRDWDPATLGPIPRKATDAVLQRQRARDERVAKFAQLREAGISVKEAGSLLGVSWDCARTYERQRLAGGAG